MRREYLQSVLDEKSVTADPLELFSKWFKEATESGDPEPNAMALATADTSGKPSVRMVLLKEFDQSGLTFFTNYESRKAVELEKNHRAALLLYWSDLERQIRIEGEVAKSSRAVSEKYFATRPRGAQVAAFVSPQSKALRSREVLEASSVDAEKQFGERPVPCPENWGGYTLKPSRYEFWQGRENRLHDRIEYVLEGGVWKTARLAP